MKAGSPSLFPRPHMETLLSMAHEARLAVIGDICLDLYWHADMTRSTLSRETPHFPLPIIREEWNPGGAGNVACNIAALTRCKPALLGVVGTDWRGKLLLDALECGGVEVCNVIRTEERVTNAYIKPMRKGISDTVYEDPRLDFDNHEPLSPALEAELIARLDALAPDLDALCVCDQLPMGCVTPKVRDAIMAWGSKGLKVIVDSREHIASYRHVIVKPNEVEAAQAVMGGAAELPLEGLADAAAQLARRNGRPALITVGSRGCLLADETAVMCVPPCPTNGLLDICGAGDTFMSAFVLCYGSGAALSDAVLFANTAASVTIQKIGTTGTALPDEILGAYDTWLEKETGK